MKKRIRKIAVILIIMIVIVLFYIFFSYSAYTEIDYCKDIARKINWIGAEQFECGAIFEYEDVIEFKFGLKFYEYDEDTNIQDMMKFRDYIVEYLKKHPDNKLNDKKIYLWFRTIANEWMKVYNYNFLLDEDMKVATDFVYFDRIEVENISAIKDLNDAKVIHLLSASNVDSLDFFDEWNELEYMYVVTQTFTEEEIQYTKQLLPQAVVEFTSEK